MIEFLAGAVTLAYIVGAVFFLRFWRRTRDRLFLAFCVAFSLLALNQVLAFLLNVYSEPQSFIYWLRVVGFLLILVAIMDKNLTARRPPARPAK